MDQARKRVMRDLTALEADEDVEDRGRTSVDEIGIWEMLEGFLQASCSNTPAPWQWPLSPP